MNIGTVLQDTLQDNFEPGTFMNELMSQVVNSTGKFKEQVEQVETNDEVMFTKHSDQVEINDEVMLNKHSDEEANKENANANANGERRMPHISFIAHKKVPQVSNEEVLQEEVPKKKKKKELDSAQKESQKMCEKRSKRTKTLFGKTKGLLEKTDITSAMLIIKSHSGDWLVLGSPDMEERLVQGQPLIDVSTQKIFKYVNADLELSITNPPEVREVNSPQKLPLPLRTTVPGGASIKELVQGQSQTRKLKELTKSPSKPKNRKKVVLAAPKIKKRTYNRQKKELKGANNVTEDAEENVDDNEYLNDSREALKLPGQEVVQPKSTSEAFVNKRMVCSFNKCGKVWSVENNKRWVLCDDCSNWACGVCSKTEKLSKEQISKVSFKCENCRKVKNGRKTKKVR